MLTFGLFATVLLLILSLKWMWSTHIDERRKTQYITFENFLLLLITYLIVLIGFGLIYILLEVNGWYVLVENGVKVSGSFFELMEVSMYFSAVTLLSVGYGDITPIALGRWIAIFEALIGYVMPAAFVVRTVIDFEKKS